MRRLFSLLALATIFVVSHAGAVRAADENAAPAAYDKWTTGKQSQPGLFTIWRDNGHLYLEASAAQLDQDYIEHAVPVTGLGGWDITPGNPYFDFARIIRFTRADNKVSITWPNTSFVAPKGTPQERAVKQTFAPSVVAVTPIVAEDAAGRVVFDAAPLLGDISDMTDSINQSVGATDPQSQYHLDSDRTFYGPAKAFPKNDVIEVDQTFSSAQPPASVDNVPDPRSLQLKMDYNLIEAPADGYVPRIADDRIGFYPNIQLQFGNDSVDGRQVRYIMRWNFAPADPSRPSPATHPMVWYISNTIPARYHDTVRNALLEWNNAFAKAGILNAIVVQDQPDDPNFDPQDIRYNVIRWLTESNNGGFAQAGSVWDPRTGELFHTGIVLDADLMSFNYVDWRDLANPARLDGASAPGRAEMEFGRGMRAQAAFGRVALQAMGMFDAVSREAFDMSFLRSIVLHESGHEMGLQHNFIGSTAYTARDLQSKAFTSRYGVTNSVMEYSPLNLWPKGTGQGDYWQTALGPYDYHAIHWGYATVPGARTPEDEVSTLKRWASTWSNPQHLFAMDEDVAYFNAHAIDPRVSHWDLTDDNLGWCETQIKMGSSLLGTISARYPKSGEGFDSARTAFGDLLGHNETCLFVVEHYVGGEYVNRSHAGDPGFNGVPLSPVPRAVEQRAFGILDRYLFSDAAWNYSPSLLRKLVYTEWVTDFPQPPWAYNPQPRHDMPVADLAEGVQSDLLHRVFQPLMLQRLDDLSMKYRPGETMSLSDLFSWMHASAFGDLHGSASSSIPEVHRNLQQQYVRLLAGMVLHPTPQTPYDAQSLARAELKSLKTETRSALSSGKLDAVTRAHLDSLYDIATQTLDAKPITM